MIDGNIVLFNFYEDIEKFDIKFLLGWSLPTKSLSTSNKRYMLFINKSDVDNLEKKFPFLKEASKRFKNKKRRYDRIIEHMSKLGDLIYKFKDIGWMFTKYEMYMDAITHNYDFNKYIDTSIDVEFDDFKEMIDKYINDPNNQLLLDKLRNSLKFAEDKYNEIKKSGCNKSNPLKKYDGWPAKVLQMREEGAADEDIVKYIMEFNDGQSKKDGKISNTMIGLLLYDKSLHTSDWRKIGQRAVKKYKKKFNISK